MSKDAIITSAIFVALAGLSVSGLYFVLRPLL